MDIEDPFGSLPRQFLATFLQPGSIVVAPLNQDGDDPKSVGESVKLLARS